MQKQYRHVWRPHGKNQSQSIGDKVTPTGLFFILFRLAFAANERTAGVSRQPLLARKIRDLVRDPCKRRLGVIGKLRLFNKVVDRERARESCTSAGGQGVIRSRKIVSESLGAVSAQTISG